MKVSNRYDSTLGKKSFDKVKPTLAEIPADRVQRVTVDLQTASIITMHVAGFIQKPEIKSAFLDLPKSRFAPARIGELLDLSQAIWFARTQAMTDEAQASSAVAFAERMERAAGLRDRMIRVCEYNFAKNPVLLAEVASIRNGTGHQNMASDLTRLANLYEAHGELLAKDNVWYRASDLAAARKMASEIMALIGSKSVGASTDTLARLWTRLLETYQDVRRAALFLFADEPAVLEQFPSLHAATRSKRSTAGASDEEVEVEIEDESESDAVVPAAPANAIATAVVD